MTRGTEKAGRTGRFGPRYGTRIRRRVANIERVQFDKHRCPQCLTGELSRASTSIWECRKCDHKFAGGAYIPRTPAFGKAQASKDEIEAVSEELEEELEAEPAEPVPEPEPEAEAEEPAEEPEDEPEAEAEEAPEEPEEEEEPRDIGTLFED